MCLFSQFFSNNKLFNYAKFRYIDQFYDKIKTKDEREKFVDDSLYINFMSRYKFFKNNPWFGVGNKNYRIETCDTNKALTNKEYYCLTHPHQVYVNAVRARDHWNNNNSVNNFLPHI